MTIEEFIQQAKDVAEGRESRWRALGIIRSEWFPLLTEELQQIIRDVDDECKSSI